MGDLKKMSGINGQNHEPSEDIVVSRFREYLREFYEMQKDKKPDEGEDSCQNTENTKTE